MPTAVNLLREPLHYRRAAFDAGLRANGFQLAPYLPCPRPGDLLVIWNRYSRFAAEAERFEKAGARVLVAENGYLGKSWQGGKWFSLAIGHHAGAGAWRHGGPGRWDSWGVELAPWREDGGDTIIFGQRGIGEPGLASPSLWAELTQRRLGGRIRPHPGKDDPHVPLFDDLEGVSCALTWASSAALHALIRGIPVWYAMPGWIGAAASRHLSLWGRMPAARCDAARLETFRRLAWAQWRLEEIADGTAIRSVLAG